MLIAAAAAAMPQRGEGERAGLWAASTLRQETKDAALCPSRDASVGVRSPLQVRHHR